MKHRAKLVCQCGGEVPRPLPPKCPHCGRIISGVHRPRGAWIWPVVVVGGLFSLLLAGVYILLQVFAS